MKITIIGSSHGVPEANRKCSCIMVQVGGNVYYVDMGTSGIDPLRKRNIPVETVKGIFITHMHGDHINGLVEFVDLITWYFHDADPVVCLPNPDAGKIIDSWLDVTHNGCRKEIRYEKTHPGLVFDDGLLRVTAIPTRHDENSHAYLLEAEGKRVLITGDMKHPGVDFPTAALDKPLDLLIGEAAHFEAEEYLPVFEKCHIKKFCVTHYTDHFLPGVIHLCETLNSRGIKALRATDDLELTV